MTASHTTATQTTTALTATTPRSTARLVRTGLAATVSASVTTTTIAAVGAAAGIGLDVSGAPIPIPGFAVLTAVFSLVGLVLAAVLVRLVRHPRSTFVQMTVALTALSLIPDLAADAGSATKVLLMLTHLAAAAIVVPALARRLPA